MSKGFSLLELSAIIVCGGVAMEGMSDKTGISLSAIGAQIITVKREAKDYVDADRYLAHVARKLQQTNGS